MKKIISLLLIFIFGLSAQSIHAAPQGKIKTAAPSKPQITKTQQRDGHGCYVTILDQDSDPVFTRANGKVRMKSSASQTLIRKGRKTVYYKTGAGVILWSVTVHGKFSYTRGKSSICKSSSVSASAPSPSWKISSKSSSKSGDTAKARATAKRYSGKTIIEPITKSITLRCDKYGNLS